MLKVYNTMSGEKEVFKPLKEGEVSIYCCGVTPYNYPHIGNARPFVTWDVIRRFFAYEGYNVHYVQNFTDVDDKIINTSNKEGVTWKEIADRYIDGYFEAMDALNVKHADIYPRVSDTIPEIIEMIQGLVDNGYAYPVDGDVYFAVEKFAEYGKLSGRKLSDMQAGARIEVDQRKQHPMDFALWKAAKPGEPFWESPWGQGRPGWHIECSAMSLKFLGESFDFHGGGSDLIFPHHENEIAQSQCFLGDFHSFAQHWVHNGFITIHDEKMSKSKNNFFTVQDILKKYPGEVIRFFILQTHYRSPLDFSDERLKEAQAGLTRLRNSAQYADELIAMQGAGNSAAEILSNAESYKKDFVEAMEDDFNTALAISYLFALSKDINKYYADVTSGKCEYDSECFAAVRKIYLELAGVIGIFEGDMQVAGAKADGLSDEEIEKLIAEREEARKAKNWARADEIRDTFKEQGIILEDSANGTRWKRA